MQNTNRIGRRVIRIHLGSELGIELGTPVNRARGRSMSDDRNDVERDRTHVEQHTRDVKEWGKEKNSLAADENGENMPS